MIFHLLKQQTHACVWCPSQNDDHKRSFIVEELQKRMINVMVKCNSKMVNKQWDVKMMMQHDMVKCHFND
jgi:hypothetical protein